MGKRHKYKHIVLGAKEHLFRAGDRATKLYLVQSGKISLYVRNDSGAVEIRRIEAGGIIGEGRFIGDSTWSEDAIALLETEVMEIPVQMAMDQMSNLPDFWRGLIRQLSDRVKAAERERSTQQKIEEQANQQFEATLAKCLEVMNLAARCARVKGAPSEREIRTVSVRLHELPFYYVKNVMKILEGIGWLRSDFDGEEIRHKIDLDKIDLTLSLILQAMRTKSEDLLLPSASESRMLKTLSSMSKLLRPNGKGIARVWASELAQEIRELGFEPDLGQIDRIHNRGLELSKLSTENGIMIEFHADDVKSVATAWEMLCASRRAAPFSPS